MQTNFFSNVPNSDGIQKKCFSILKNCFQLHCVLFWYNWGRNYSSNLQGNSFRIEHFSKNEKTLTLIKGVLTLPTFGQICNVSALKLFLSGFFQVKHHVLMTLKLQKKMQHVSRNEKRSDLWNIKKVCCFGMHATKESLRVSLDTSVKWTRAEMPILRKEIMQFFH